MSFLFNLKGFNFLYELFLKSSIILSLSLAFIYLLKNRSARTRHFILGISLLSLILLPFICQFAPQWETRLIPYFTNNKTAQMDESSLNNLSSTNIFTNSIDTKTNKSFRPSFITYEASQSYSPFNNWSKKLITYSLIFLWITTFTYLISRIFWRLIGVKMLSRTGTPLAKYPWDFLLSIFYQRHPLKRKILLLKHQKVKTPMTYGIFKPVILIPQDSKNWSFELCSSILCHELYHIKRSDFLIKLLSWMICTLYWFNPLAWVVFKRLKIEQEKACDEMVVGFGIKPSSYASVLLKIKKNIDYNTSLSSLGVGMTNNWEFKDRLVSILKKSLPLKEVTMKTKLFFISIMIIAVALLGTAKPLVNSNNSQSDSISIETDSNNQTQDLKEDKSDQKKAIKVKNENPKSEKTIWIQSNNDKNTITIYADDLTVKNLKDLNFKKGDLYTIGKDGKVKIVKDKKGTYSIYLLSKDKNKKLNIKADKLILKTTKSGKDKKGNITLKGGHLSITTDKDGNKLITILDKDSKKRHIVREHYIHTDTLKRLEKIKDSIKELEESIKEIKNKDTKEKIYKNLEKLKKELKRAQKTKRKIIYAQPHHHNLLIIDLEKSKEELHELKEHLHESEELLHAEEHALEEIHEDQAEEELKTIEKLEEIAELEDDELHKGHHKIEKFISKKGAVNFKIAYQGVFNKVTLDKFNKDLKKFKKTLPSDCSVKTIIKKGEENTIIAMVEFSHKSKKTKDSEKLQQRIVDFLKTYQTKSDK